MPMLPECPQKRVNSSDRAMAKAFLAGATGGMVAGAVATTVGGAFTAVAAAEGAAAGLSGGLLEVAVASFLGTGTGAALTKAANLRNCLDEVQIDYKTDVALTGFVAGGAGIVGGVSSAHFLGTGITGGAVSLSPPAVAAAESAAAIVSAEWDSHASMWGEL